MAEAKKRLLTYAGLKALEDELETLKVDQNGKKLQLRSKRQESREIFPRMQSMMRQKMNKEISKRVSKNLKAF
mgnify:CR=1 FL=1